MVHARRWDADPSRRLRVPLDAGRPHARRHVVLVGDAAHLTPPFLGQGLCAGLRDAANVAWKLDLVLRGLAPDALLDTVAAERQPQNEWVIGFAIELGKHLCQLDPGAAAQRDATLRQAGPPPPIEMAPLNDGVIHRGADEPTIPWRER